MTSGLGESIRSNLLNRVLSHNYPARRRSAGSGELQAGMAFYDPGETGFLLRIHIDDEHMPSLAQLFFEAFEIAVWNLDSIESSRPGTEAE